MHLMRDKAHCDPLINFFSFLYYKQNFLHFDPVDKKNKKQIMINWCLEHYQKSF